MPQNTLSNHSHSPRPPASGLRLDANSLAQDAFGHIRTLIFSGSLRAGEKIPEEKIAQLLDVSRTPIREALRQLERYGLVAIKPRSYAMVVCVSNAEADQIAHTRSELEKLAARYLLRCVSKEDVSVLRGLAEEALARLEEGKIAEALLLDGSFHLEMARRCGNRIVYDIIERLDAKSTLIRIRIASEVAAARLPGMLALHLQIVDKLEAGDEDGLLQAIDRNVLPELGWISPLPPFSPGVTA